MQFLLYTTIIFSVLRWFDAFNPRPARTEDVAARAIGHGVYYGVVVYLCGHSLGWWG